MWRTAILVCLAATYHATAAPFAAAAATGDTGESPKIILSLGEDADEPDIDDGGVDLPEAPREDEGDPDDLDLMNRDLRSKNFLRFGRSSARPSRTTSTKDGNTIRFSRGEPDDNFIRLGRSANFVRLGRGGSDDSVKTPSIRSSNSNFIRLGRGKNDFIRLGRNANEDDIEDVSDNNESLARMSRGGSADSNFIRLGKGGFPSSNFVRLGRKDNFLRFGKANNFLRFGRGGSGSNFIRLGKSDNFIRFGRGGSGSNFIRLGKADNDLPRFSRGGSGSNFIRLGKADNFLRFGRGVPNLSEIRFGEGKNGDGSHFGRGKLADRNFIRLGRSDPEAPRGGDLDNAIKAEDVNAWARLVRPASRTIRLGKRGPQGFDNKFMRFGRDAENVEEHSNNNRSKRSTATSEDEDATPEDDYENDEKAVEDATFRYYLSRSAGVPNYVFAPELSAKHPLYSKRGAGGSGNGNFIRLG